MLSGDPITTDANPCRSHGGIVLVCNLPLTLDRFKFSPPSSCGRSPSASSTIKKSSATSRISSSIISYFLQQCWINDTRALSNSFSSFSHRWTHWCVFSEMYFNTSFFVSCHVPRGFGTSYLDQLQKLEIVSSELKCKASFSRMSSNIFD